ncbi:MAG TPA: ribosome maturation factor RimP [Actinomycetota bacterium]|jgi:ribosome maturation factor RimP|nr:ribosome maturation factor RimP [Actinomycetota bacterium]
MKGGGLGALEVVRELAESAARRHSLVVWDVEIAGGPGRQVVRVYVDSADGVDLDTVADVSEEISRALDLKDPIQGRYILEVSSPGLERTLKRPEHFVLCMGREVVVKTTEPLSGPEPGGHRLEGVIAGTSDEEVVVTTSDGGSLGIPFTAIKSARTVFRWK